mmetsp:Transcript_12197/g.23251  ORF Transcript_12197/g.23251 Transcript_12197/m.23251 type:complete len:552 (+) Transcript_12197:1668-3323(+)
MILCRAWVAANPDKLMVIKFYAPWCRACKSVEPKFLQISKDKKYANIPIIFGQLSVQHNKQFVKSLGIMALPSMQIYAGSEGLVENFPCGPSKIPMLKRKLTETINAKVDPTSFVLKVDCANPENSEAAPCKTRSLALDEEAESSEIDEVISDTRKEENLVYLRTGVPYFKDFDDDEFYDLMDKAKLVTFEPGDIVMRQGMEGSVFYVIESGEVEITVKTAFEDPLTTPPDYLGAIINILGPHNYFGERALITKEPRAASIRALQKTRCFAFDVADIPTSSVLSGKKSATADRMAEVNSKYGTDVYDIDLIADQFDNVSIANQQRGSVFTPQPIRGVDIDEDYVPPELEMQDPDGMNGSRYDATDRVLSLLVRFNQIKRAAKCFGYIVKSKPNFGDPGESRRRALLVSKLTRAQREEFSELFNIIDSSRDGFISILELRRAMDSVGETRSDAELESVINNANPNIDGNTQMSKSEFMGIMAESEFYYLFLSTFEMLDVNKTGYVAAGDLDRVLCGVRDLISDDRMSIIDTSDLDMQVDYETYADMLLGKPL